MGNPSLYRPEYCAKLIDMGKEGRGVSEFCSDVGISRNTFYVWSDAHPEFAEARELHRAHCQAWWEKAGREGMFMQTFNATIWTKNMNNRFREEWGEKVDVNANVQATVKGAFAWQKPE